eukprot:TRINITY_DN649_c11_g1_i1.p1 TRINITY_DN649_c11_g1~~TRINITY_DN649_c11_g1_i1.p1  ORF type:complete len:182 (+),score=35.78 TRINITY_DN649_c11_g1_i1:61-546(+)
MSSVCSDELPPVLLADFDDCSELGEGEPVEDFVPQAHDLQMAVGDMNAAAGLPLGGMGLYQYPGLPLMGMGGMGVPKVQLVPVPIPMMSAPFMGTPLPCTDEGSSASGASTPPHGTNGLNVRAKEFIPQLLHRYPSPASVVFPSEPVEGIPISQASFPNRA